MWIKFLKFLLLFTVFVTPLIPAFFGLGFELIKVVVFLFLTIVSGGIFTYLLSIKKIKIGWTKIKIAGLVFLIVLTLTTVFGIHPLNSLTGEYPYYQGLILYWLLFLLFLQVCTIGISIKRLCLTITVAALIVSSAAMGQFILLNLLGIEIPNYAGRVISTFGQPNLYSGFLLLSLPFAWQFRAKRIYLILIITLGVMISLSKAAIILLCALGLFVFLKNTAHKVIWAFFIGIVFFSALTYSLTNSTGLIWDEAVRPFTKAGREGHLIEKRAYIFPVMINIYSKNPLLGYGLDSVRMLYKREFADFKPEIKDYPPLYSNLKNLIIDRSHNYFLDLLIFSGVLGLGAYLYLVYLLFKAKKPGFLKIFLILYLIWIQFQIQSIVHLMFFWLIAGVIDRKKILREDES